jgi:hypothetical protein
MAESDSRGGEVVVVAGVLCRDRRKDPKCFARWGWIFVVEGLGPSGEISMALHRFRVWCVWVIGLMGYTSVIAY